MGFDFSLLKGVPNKKQILITLTPRTGEAALIQPWSKQVFMFFTSSSLKLKCYGTCK